MERVVSSYRKAEWRDFNYIRKLPLQLGSLSTGTLLLKKLRLMMQAPEFELLVWQDGPAITGCMALHYKAAPEDGFGYVLIRNFGVDQSALHNGIADQMESLMVELAEKRKIATVVVTPPDSNIVTTRFYQQHGYQRQAQHFIKNI
jgi:N-acetylglutamate synthase-like GNAT family acetyltransferase